LIHKNLQDIGRLILEKNACKSELIREEAMKLCLLHQTHRIPLLAMNAENSPLGIPKLISRKIIQLEQVDFRYSQLFLHRYDVTGFKFKHNTLGLLRFWNDKVYLKALAFGFGRFHEFYSIILEYALTADFNNIP
jgi:hypothetical protein